MTDPIFRAQLADLTPEYDSQIESHWHKCGALIVQDETGVAVVRTHYHPLKFNIQGGWYEPDFLHLLEDGRCVLIEVKRSKRQKGYTASRLRLKTAAALYPFFTWAEARGRGENWELEVIG